MSYLVHEPNIKLHINSKNIKNININTYNLSKKLILVMKFYYGIGLAAVQIGILKKIVSINYLIYKKRKSITLINTKIIKNSKEYIKIEEGCLSYKNNYNINVYRHHYVKIYYLDLQNKKQYLNIKKKILSSCIQHEVDHINGIVFLDKLIYSYKYLKINKYIKLKIYF